MQLQLRGVLVKKVVQQGLSLPILASSLFVLASSTHAGFTISAVKTDAGAKDIVEVFFRNDGTGGSGTTLAAYQVDYAGTPLQFRWVPSPDEDTPAMADIYNQVNDPNLSWFRVHPARTWVFHATPVLESNAWSSPITDFQVVYTTAGVGGLNASNGPGVRFGRLVLPDGGHFRLDTRVGGEVGPAFDADYDYFIANQAPVITGGGTVVSDVSVPGLRTHRVQASDLDGLIQTFHINDLSNAAAVGFNIVSLSASEYEIRWDPSVVARGEYQFSLVAGDTSVQSNSTTTAFLNIQVVPEPAGLAFVAGVIPAMRRKRRS